MIQGWFVFSWLSWLNILVLFLAHNCWKETCSKHGNAQVQFCLILHKSNIPCCYGVVLHSVCGLRRLEMPEYTHCD